LGQASDVDIKILDVALSSDGTRLIAALNRVFFGFDTLGNPVPIFWGGIIVIDTQTWTQSAEISVGDVVANIGITPDGKTAYVAGIEDLANPTVATLQVFIVDLEANASLGTIRGLGLPVDFRFNVSKPAIPDLQIPELIIF
jgi:DNA-binding beta-propeller fold protein YncE